MIEIVIGFVAGVLVASIYWRRIERRLRRKVREQQVQKVRLRSWINNGFGK